MKYTQQEFNKLLAKRERLNEAKWGSISYQVRGLKSDISKGSVSTKPLGHCSVLLDLLEEQYNKHIANINKQIAALEKTLNRYRQNGFYEEE